MCVCVCVCVFTYKNKKCICLFYCSGLCAVYRSKAGEFEPSSDSPTHNSHWLMKNKVGGGGGGPSRYVGYYDATSLYPSSSKLFCFFVLF